MLELAVLGLLSEQPLHGYELKKRLSETLGPLWGISFGSLVPGPPPARTLGRDRGRRAVETAPAPFVATGSVKGDLAAAPRPSPPARRAADAQGLPRNPRRRAAVRRAADRRTGRRRAHLRVEAVVLPSPRAPPPGSRSSNAGARSSRNAWPRRAEAPPASPIATPGRSSSTGTNPPSTISRGSRS